MSLPPLRGGKASFSEPVAQMLKPHPFSAGIGWQDAFSRATSVGRGIERPNPNPYLRDVTGNLVTAHFQELC